MCIYIYIGYHNTLHSSVYIYHLTLKKPNSIEKNKIMKFRNFSEIVFVLVLLPDHGYFCGGDIFAPQFYQTMNTLHTFAVEGAKCHFSFYIEKFRKITSAAVWAKGFKFRKLGCHVFWPGIPGTFSGK